MHITPKITLLTFFFGSLSLVMFSAALYFYERDSELTHQRELLLESAVHQAENIQVLLINESRVAGVLAHNPAITEALRRSNRHFDDMPDTNRQETIQALNRRWQANHDLSDPFLRDYMQNGVATLLKDHLQRHPNIYGEIFVTDRHGIVVGTTGKLSRLNHAQDYWWQLAYAEGLGRVFFDDRGFDTRVGDYLLGIVVPIHHGDEVIGILKANLKIISALEEEVNVQLLIHQGRTRISRSGGRVVLETGHEPLSTALPQELAMAVAGRNSGLLELSDGSGLAAYSPVAITRGDTHYGYGGSFESLDHMLGNSGEAWMVVRELTLAEALAGLHQRTRAALGIDALIVALFGIIAFVAGKRIAVPIVLLAETAERIGNGDFETRLKRDSDDELGQLVNAFNRMTENLTATFDHLREEMAQRQQVETTLRESEDVLLTFLDGIHESAFLADPEGILLQCNSAFAKRLGIPRKQLLDQNIYDHLPPDIAEQRRHHTEALMQSGDPMLFEENWGEHILEKRLYPIWDHEGRIICIAGIGFDISERKRDEARLTQLAAELERSNSELEQFAYIASHDLQEPLRKIMAFGDRLHSHIATNLDETGTDYLSRMQGAAQRMQHLIEALLQYSRISTRDHPHRPVKLATIMGNVCSDLETRIEQLGAEVTFSGMPTVMGDSTQLEQLFLNLIGNALKYHKQDCPPRVEVAAEFLEENRVTIHVSDNGIGFKEQYLERIFQPFQRLHARNEYEGTGIGLALCNKIVRRHGGTIDATSKLGEGSVFSVTLPLIQEATT
jgi:PAS domain S-box-containing protein